MYKYYIEDLELDSIHFDDSNQRSYRLDTEGDTIDQMVDNARIVALSWDGIELWTDHVSECSDGVIEYIQRVIANQLNNGKSL